MNKIKVALVGAAMLFSMFGSLVPAADAQVVITRPVHRGFYHPYHRYYGRVYPTYGHRYYGRVYPYYGHRANLGWRRYHRWY